MFIVHSVQTVHTQNHHHHTFRHSSCTFIAEHQIDFELERQFLLWDLQQKNYGKSHFLYLYTYRWNSQEPPTLKDFLTRSRIHERTTSLRFLAQP